MSSSKPAKPLMPKELAATLHNITTTLEDVLSKVTSNTTRLIDLSDTVARLSTAVSAIKADQGCLHITINKVQTKQLKVDGKMPLEPRP
jgi:hypothetical protein